MAVSNTRPLGIFTGYMILAAALTLKSIAIIRSQSRRRRRRRATPPPKDGSPVATSGLPRGAAVAVFSLLAALSLATTWYHMFRFFEWSYQQWAFARYFEGIGMTGEEGLMLGEWLKDTSLFKQAWASTLETGPRAWWSLQIFGFCANWSVLLAVQARKRSISHAWVFVLLGQVVAISFAANLSFLAILCSPAVDESSASRGVKKQEGGKTKSESSFVSWHTITLIVTLAWATSIPSAIGKPGFLSLLLGPHLLAFVPLTLNKLLPGRLLGEPAWAWKAASMIWVLAAAFKGVLGDEEGLSVVLKTLYEHPAVSSVGWDVICCWISFGAWQLIGTD
ncbi:hypothetical protein CTRI78_v004383 [Colletotrichum trifolii]|uniref:Alpha-mannosyltransferase alg11p n=1 Tax=Colletotrichum trifolii TaxID=5466 RepID=A0A4R8RHB5_COLTR|nr:hypothetical protein CTRI78_v004383 [Colletotrichum trifolii]